ncbi:hypothetical protein B0T10DRAFT_461340 [Thelonectria olida]|uniref:Uncharacterized protein n=1 Tax=Thelonectria olida TaxID=1576542 RepID=A0A9P9AQW4_9HYPO|nr:hypothetical protein B0T10DRAFT_461340 [Thelonectria olida]
MKRFISLLQHSLLVFGSLSQNIQSTIWPKEPLLRNTALPDLTIPGQCEELSRHLCQQTTSFVELVADWFDSAMLLPETLADLENSRRNVASSSRLLINTCLGTVARCSDWQDGSSNLENCLVKMSIPSIESLPVESNQRLAHLNAVGQECRGWGQTLAGACYSDPNNPDSRCHLRVFGIAVSNAIRFRHSNPPEKSTARDRHVCTAAKSDHQIPQPGLLRMLSRSTSTISTPI